MRHLLTFALLLCAAMAVLAAPSAPVNPMDWVGPAAPNMIHSSAISDDGLVAALYNEHGVVDIMDVPQSRIIKRYVLTGFDNGTRKMRFGPYGPAMCLSGHGEYLALNSGDSVLWWNRLTGEPVQHIRPETSIASILFIPGTSHLLIATTGGVLSEYDCGSEQMVKETQIGQAVYCLSMLTDLGKLAGIVKQDTMVLIDPTDYSLSYLKTQSSSFPSIVVSGHGSFIGYDKKNHLLSAFLPSGDLARWKMPNMELVSAEQSKFDIKLMTPNGYAITNDDFNLSIRDITMKAIKRSTNEIPTVNVSTSANGHFALAGSFHPVMVDIENRSFRWVTDMSFDGYQMGFSAITSGIKIHPSLRRDYRQIIPGLYSVSTGADFDATAGKYTVFPTKSGLLVLRDITTGKQIGKYTGSEFYSDFGEHDRNLTMSNDARLLAGIRSKLFLLRDRKSGQHLSVPDIASAISSGKPSPDGRLVAMAGFDFPAPPLDDYGRGSTIFIAKSGSTKVIRKLFPHQGYVLALQFNLKGTRLISIDEANTLRMWDTTSGKLLFTIPNAGIDAYFCMDDRRIFVRANSCAYDLFDATTGKYLARTWRTYQDYATVSVDGRYDGTENLRDKQIWTFEQGRAGTLSKSSLLYTPGLWGALSR